MPQPLAGQGEYYGGFVTHYLGPIIYPEGLTRSGQYLVGLLQRGQQERKPCSRGE